MNIRFIDADIDNFKSIGNAHVTFGSRGIVTVSGVNEYESNSSSNGSGKSSMFSALFWCLYGKTPEGIACPNNRHITNSTCRVSCRFSVDESNFAVCRTSDSSGSQKVSINENGKDVSSMNRTNSDKKLRDDILKMNPDIFLSLVYLSQGFSNRLSLLSPTSRKERLEILTDTTTIVDSFSQNLQNLESYVQDKIRKVSCDRSRCEGKREEVLSNLESLNKRLEEQSSFVDYFEFEGVRYTSKDCDSLQSEKSKLYNDLTTLSSEMSDLSQKRSEFIKSIDLLSYRYNQLESEIQKARSYIQEISENRSCPTCGQVLVRDSAESLISRYRENLSSLESEKEDNVFQKSQLQPQLDCTNKVIQDKKNYYVTLDNQIKRLTHIISHIPAASTIDVEYIQSCIRESSETAQRLSEESSSLQSQVDEAESYLNVIKHCRQLVTKQFRSYLLQSSIAFLNSRLEVYSSYLFSNRCDVISMSTDSQKLDLMLGDASYDSLSGGEKRKVDLAVTLAQKDLASEIAGIHCNILILDEIMESLDETATGVTLRLLEKASESLESMFIISHNNYSIPSDGNITVYKGVNQISSIVES